MLIYISYKMKAAFLVLAIIATAVAVTIPDTKSTQLSTSRRALKFNNFTGAGVRPEQITSFINFANSASGFYKADLEANAKYIKQNMDDLYGAPGQSFFVVIQAEQNRFSWLVWITNENLIASVAGINKINTDWSYLFLKFLAPSTGEDYAFITGAKKGPGIDADTEALINDVVNQYETGDTCTCNDYETMDIGYGLINGQGVAWSTICGSSINSGAYVNAVRGLWIHTKPRNCFYTFYVSQ